MTHEGETVPPLRVVSDDLAARLRHFAGVGWLEEQNTACREAADEIELLRAERIERMVWITRAEQAEARLAAVREICEQAIASYGEWSEAAQYHLILALLDGEEP